MQIKVRYKFKRKFNPNKQYWGNPCIHGHLNEDGLSPRYFTNDMCAECNALQQKPYTRKPKKSAPPKKVWGQCQVTDSQIKALKEQEITDRRNESLIKFRQKNH